MSDLLALNLMPCKKKAAGKGVDITTYIVQQLGLDNGQGIIYSIVCPISRRVVYVGQTINLKQRAKLHRTTGRSGKHEQRPLYKWMNELFLSGQDPIFEVLEHVAIPDLNGRELYWIQFWQVRTTLYNLAVVGQLKAAS